MTIPSYRLPVGIEKGSRFSPTFQNVIQEALAGNEQRYAQWTKCRGVGDISYGLLNSTDATGDFRAIVAIYRAHFGSLLPFRFKDWTDYSCTDELFGTGDGSTVAFQLRKTYDPLFILTNVAGTVLYVRDITLVATTSTPVIKVDGVTKTVVTDYTISSSGLVTFTSAPANTKICTWTGEFDVPVRFDGPLDVIMNEGDIVSIGSLPIKEVIGES
jgi:uncharacterized protein (TIGR02217 family)